MEQNIGTLVERLDRLEQENSRMRRSARLMKIAMAPAIAVCLAVSSAPQALSKGPSLKVISAQQINLVSPGGAVLASLGTTADGNVLTFFDSSGKKTLTLGNNSEQSSASLIAWDNNAIIPGTGIPRTVIGEANPNIGPINGFGTSTYDGNGNLRTTLGLSYDSKVGAVVAYDVNGSTTGLIDDDKTFHDQGFFANDLNGKNRIFAGNALDGTTFNEVALSNGAGQLRTGLFNTATNGDGFNTIGENGEPRISLFTSTDDSVSGYDVFDGTSLFGTQRLFAGLTPSGSTVDTFDASHTVTGHLP